MLEQCFISDSTGNFFYLWLFFFLCVCVIGITFFPLVMFSFRKLLDVGDFDIS